MIRITCPSCESRFKVDDRFAGKRGKCAKCGAVLVVPAADEAPTEPVEQGEPAAPAAGAVDPEPTSEPTGDAVDPLSELAAAASGGGSDAPAGRDERDASAADHAETLQNFQSETAGTGVQNTPPAAHQGAAGQQRTAASPPQQQNRETPGADSGGSTSAPPRAWTLGVTSLALAVVSLLVCWIPWIGFVSLSLSLAGLVAGVVALIMALARRNTGLGFPAAGTVMSFLTLLLVTQMVLSAIEGPMNMVTGLMGGGGMGSGGGGGGGSLLGGMETLDRNTSPTVVREPRQSPAMSRSSSNDAKQDELSGGGEVNASGPAVASAASGSSRSGEAGAGTGGAGGAGADTNPAQSGDGVGGSAMAADDPTDGKAGGGGSDGDAQQRRISGQRLTGDALRRELERLAGGSSGDNGNAGNTDGGNADGGGRNGGAERGQQKMRPGQRGRRQALQGQLEQLAAAAAAAQRRRAPARNGGGARMGQRQGGAQRDGGAAEAKGQDEGDGESQGRKWVPASKTVAYGPLEIRIESVRVGQFSVPDILGNRGRRMRLLGVKVRLDNTSETRKIDYMSWTGPGINLSEAVNTQNPLASLSKLAQGGRSEMRPMLMDNFDNQYQPETGAKTDYLLGGGGAKPISIRPGASTTDTILFEEPVKGVEHLRLQLPARYFGGKGMIRFEIPAKQVEGLE